MALKEIKEALSFSLTTQLWRMAFLWTFSLLLSYLHLFSHTLLSLTKPISYPRTSPPKNTHRPICIITGATSGLAAAAAYSLSVEGFFVVLVGRSTYRLSKVEEDIKRRNKNAQLKYFKVDVSSFESILKFKISFQRWLLDADLHSSIQLLINNAGILATSSRHTAEGYDQMIATNYLGAFCLTKVLVPLLENSPVPSRIVNHLVYRWTKSLFEENTSQNRKFTCVLKFTSIPSFAYYCFRMSFIGNLVQRENLIMSQSCAVSTNIMREVPTYLSFMALFVLKLMGLLQSPETGSRSILDAALAPPEVSGVYFFGGKGRTIDSSASSYNAKLANELWVTSCDLFSDSFKARDNNTSY